MALVHGSQLGTQQAAVTVRNKVAIFEYQEAVLFGYAVRDGTWNADRLCRAHRSQSSTFRCKHLLLVGCIQFDEVLQFTVFASGVRIPV